MAFWTDRVFPRLCHRVLGAAEVAAERRAALGGVAGEVLELGFGTGLNVDFYSHGPGGVSRLVGLEPNPGMRRLAAAALADPGNRPRAAGARGPRSGGGTPRFPVEVVPGSAEELPFDDASFDHVVSTWTLCSIAEPLRALAEVRRVLRPGGRFVFLEHGLSPDPRVARWQRRLTPLQRRVGGGCHLDRDIAALVEQGRLRLARLDRYYLPGSPKAGGYTYRGEAAPG